MTRHPRLAGLAIGATIAFAVFGLAEAIHYTGLNPFEPTAAADPHTPELAADGSDRGGRS